MFAIRDFVLSLLPHFQAIATPVPTDRPPVESKQQMRGQLVLRDAEICLLEACTQYNTRAIVISIDCEAAVKQSSRRTSVELDLQRLSAYKCKLLAQVSNFFSLNLSFIYFSIFVRTHLTLLLLFTLFILLVLFISHSLPQLLFLF